MTFDDARCKAVADQVLAGTSSLRRGTRRAAPRPDELSSLTEAQLELLRLVEARPGISVAESASALVLAPNTVSTLVRQLSDGGWIARSVDPSDRRVARLDLRLATRHQVGAWRDKRVEVLASAVARLLPKEQELLEAMAQMLLRLAEHVGSSEVDEVPVLR